ncbi:hypothetical protein HOE425_332063 [Hoeflea sp. EC-HK425]|nr:hypothetical protein HOE425_332063 [Hoeflea sp. EC-HK425]
MRMLRIHRSGIQGGDLCKWVAAWRRCDFQAVRHQAHISSLWPNRHLHREKVGTTDAGYLSEKERLAEGLCVLSVGT